VNKPCRHCGWPLLASDLKCNNPMHRNCYRLAAKGRQPKRRPMARATDPRTLRADETTFALSMTNTNRRAA
jgi:hypothetical protein